MRKWLLTGMAACGLLTVCLPAQAVVLRYAPKVGEVHREKTTMSGRMKCYLEDGTEVIRVEMTGGIEIIRRALSQTEELTRVQTEVLGGEVTLTMGGQPDTEQMSKGRMVADFDRRGRLVKVVETQFSGGPLDRMLGPGSDMLVSLSEVSVLPEGDVGVNETWSEKVNVTVGKQQREMVAKSQLLELTTFEGRQCAKIRTSFTGPWEFSLAGLEMFGGSVDGTMDGTIQGDTVCYYDYENSVEVSSEGTIGLETQMSLSAPGMEATTMTTKMLVNIKAALVP